MTSVSLTVGGRDYRGWQTVRVSRGIETVSGSFSLGVSERWENQSDLAWPVGEGDECAVLLGSEPVITGYVDQRSPSYSKSDVGVEVIGRDRVRNLIDCSAYLGSWEFKRISLLQLAQKLCAPFSIPVSVQAGLTFAPVAKYAITPGDTGFSVLEKACRLAGVLPVSDGRGGILLTRSGVDRCKTALVEGENIIRGSARFDFSQRFHRYVVLGQHGASEESWGEAVTHVKAEATDPGIVDTARVLVVRPEGNTTPELAKRRAQWEAAVRAARSSTVTITVQGWTQGNGELWPVNKLVRVKSPRLGVYGEMLISGATYGLSVSGGTTTELTLRRPKAFLPEPTVSNADDALWKEINGV